VSNPSDSPPLFTELLRLGARTTLSPERACYELSGDPYFAILSSLLHFAANHTLTHGAHGRIYFPRNSGMFLISPAQKNYFKDLVPAQTFGGP
jgi:hypothetical protein